MIVQVWTEKSLTWAHAKEGTSISEILEQVHLLDAGAARHWMRRWSTTRQAFLSQPRTVDNPRAETGDVRPAPFERFKPRSCQSPVRIALVPEHGWLAVDASKESGVWTPAVSWLAAMKLRGA